MCRRRVRGPGRAKRLPHHLPGDCFAPISLVGPEDPSALLGHSVTPAEAEFASGRGTERLLRVARTIADLDGSIGIDAAHIEEAGWYRSPILKHAALAS